MKNGIGYAMISHGLIHLISDTLMIIFILSFDIFT